MSEAERLVQLLDRVDPDWRRVDSDPYIAAEYYDIAVVDKPRMEDYAPLDFSDPDYRNMADGFTPTDYD